MRPGVWFWVALGLARVFVSGFEGRGEDGALHSLTRSAACPIELDLEMPMSDMSALILFVTYSSRDLCFCVTGP